MTEIDYWDKAAADPDVDEKYIANIDTEACLEALSPVLKGERLLEIGSGVGRLTIPVAARTHANVAGVDLSPNMREIATKRATEAGVAERCYFIDPDKFYLMNDESFDNAYSMLTFQHIDPAGVQKYIKEVSAQLKHGGLFRFQFVEGDHHADIDHGYKEAELRRWLNMAGLDIIKVNRGLIFPEWTWITAKKGNL